MPEPVSRIFRNVRKTVNRLNASTVTEVRITYTKSTGRRSENVDGSQKYLNVICKRVLLTGVRRKNPM